MNKKLVFLLIPLLLLGACSGNPGSNSGSNSQGGGGGGTAPIIPVDDADAYDQWLDSWSQPDHLYFHYNRGSKGEYDKYCLWLWQHAPEDLEGALYAFSANPVVSKNLTLKPMSSHWMTAEEAKEYGLIDNVFYTRK